MMKGTSKVQYLVRTVYYKRDTFYASDLDMNCPSQNDEYIWERLVQMTVIQNELLLAWNQ